ncbi:MAG: hypothetical protein ACYTAN_13285 [Planctomycetota bacterium]|jgi:hypothetical protein
MMNEMTTDPQNENVSPGGKLPRWSVIPGLLVLITAAVVAVPFILARIPTRSEPAEDTGSAPGYEPAEVSASAPGYEPGEVTGDDLDIRLVGVWHQYYDDVFDASGRRVGKTIGTDYSCRGGLSTFLSRAFLFDLPPLAPDVFECPSLTIRLAGSDRCLSEADLENVRQKRRICVRAGISSTYTYTFPSDRFLPNRRTEERPVERVDALLTYWSGPRGAAELTFEGPFEAGKPVASVGDTSATASLASFYKMGRTWGTLVSLNFPAAVELDPSVLVYDDDGRRHCAGLFAPGTEVSASAVYRVPSLAPEDISAITVGEAPRERVFHNVAVVFPGAPERKYPRHREALAQRLGHHPSSDKFMPNDVHEAAGMIDVVRGFDIIRTYWALTKNVRKEVADGPDKMRFVWRGAAEMSDVERVVIIDALDAWANCDNDRIRAAGISLGLDVDLDRFIDRALEFVVEGDTSRRGAVMEALAGNAAKISPRDLARVKEMLLTSKPWLNVSTLLGCFRYSHLPEARAALVDLAKDERSFFWSLPLQQDDVVTALGPRDAWPARLKARFLVANGFESLGEAVRAEALEALPSLLTEELEIADSAAARSTIAFIAEHLDRETAADVFAGYLRGKSWFRRAGETVGLVVQYVNLWNGIDIGGLGGDPGASFRLRYDRNWREIVDAVLDWYRTRRYEPPLPDGYRVGNSDLRVIFYDPRKPEGSLIGLWRNDGRTDRAGGVSVVASDEVSFAFSVLPLVAPTGSQVGADDSYVFGSTIEFHQAEKVQSWGRMVRPPLPRAATEYGGLKVMVEHADSPTSVLSGTKAFEDWWEKYGPEVTAEVPGEDLPNGQGEENGE